MTTAIAPIGRRRANVPGRCWLIGAYLALLASLGCWAHASAAAAGKTEVGSAPAGPIPPGLFGMHILHLHHDTDTAPDWPTVRFGAARINVDSGMSWYYWLERSPGEFNWATFDKWLDDAFTHDIDLLYTFGNTPPWASKTGDESCDGSGHANCPPRLEAWDAFVDAIVQHNKNYVNPDGSVGGRIKYWELWNEPNEGTYSGDHGFWYDPSDVTTLVEKADHLHQHVKSIDPSALVLTPAYTSAGRGAHPAEHLARYLAAGGGKFADIISFHGYYRDTPEDIGGYLADIKQAMTANDLAGKPIWDTESSWGSDKDMPSADDQAAFVARAFAVHYGLGISRLYWYAWDGSAGADTPGWGTLWDKVHNAHAAALAYVEVYKWLVGATMMRRCAPRMTTTWTCRLTRPDGYEAEMVWDTAGPRAYPRPAAYMQYRTLDGNLVQTAAATISIGRKPILLESRSAW
jgi:hypothetical protein